MSIVKKEKVIFECVWHEGYCAWVIDVKDSVGNILECEDVLDEEFDTFVQGLEDKYKKKVLILK